MRRRSHLCFAKTPLGSKNRSKTENTSLVDFGRIIISKFSNLKKVWKTSSSRDQMEKLSVKVEYAC